ncbi:MAG: hypothetical protein P9X22_08485 [Candidatus Zapsychrus exili]|nr:hypothetical protein [Candidatus Zapsychrus exili]
MMTSVDFKKELEIASRSMIMIHEPKLLIKLILRMIVRKLKVKHVGMVLFEEEEGNYVLDVSRGEKGLRIPQGFTRFDQENPIIKLFNKKEFKHLTVNRNAIVSGDINRLIWKESVIGDAGVNSTKELLHEVDDHMQMLNIAACVPAYYQHNLMAVLILGEKGNEEKFEQQELDFFAALASDAAMAIRNAQLFEGLKKEAEGNRRLFI